MQQILTERHSGETKQKTNWSVSTFKGSGKFSVLKLLSLKLELSTERLKQNQFPFCLIHLPRTITSDIVVHFSRRI